MSEKTEVFKTGLTSRSILALIYIAIIFQPPMVYLYFMRGDLAILSAVQWASLLFFTEILRATGSPLTKQEATVVFLGSWMSTRFWFFTQFIYALYLRYSPVTISLGIAPNIPWFYSPPENIIWINRTFFYPSWLPVMAIGMLAIYISMISDLLIALIGYELYYKTEKLPFPTYRPQSEAVLTLTERDQTRLGMLTSVAAFSFIYGIFLYTVPMVTSTLWMGPGLSLLPIPWIDFSSLIQIVLPGASFGLPTDLLFYANGLLVPLEAAIGVFVGSFSLFFIGNNLLVTIFAGQPWNKFAEEYTFGMTVMDAWQRSVLGVWVSPVIGLTLIAGLLPLVTRPKIVVNALKSLRRTGGEASSSISIIYILVPYLVLTAILTIVDHFLVPDFPLVAFVFLNMAWPFLYMLVVGRGQATAVDFSIPYVKEFSILASGYKGYDAWFAPTCSPYGWLGHYAICGMTETKPTSYIKAVLIVSPIAFIIGFLLVNVFWGMAPMPSALYPGIQLAWPIAAINQSVFIAGGRLMRFDWLIGGMAVAAVSYFALQFLGWSAAFIGVIAGVVSPLPYALATLIGAIAGRLLRRRFGDTYRKNVATVVAGIALGLGLAVGVGSAASIIIRGIWVKPF